MKLALLASIALNLVFVALLVFVGGRANRVVSGLIDHAQKAQERRLDAMQATREENVDLAFLGDSLTWEGAWAEYFPEQTVINRGVGGDRVDDLAARLTGVTDHNPQQLFVMAGINDLNFDRPVDEIILSYEKLFDRIESELPDTQVILQSVLPTNNSWVIDIDRRDIATLNTYLQSEARERSWTFLDLQPIFTDQKGDLKADLSNDGIHLRGNGYKLWRNALDPVILK